MGWSICMKNSMNIHKIAGVLCVLQSVTNLGAKCNQTPPLTESWLNKILCLCSSGEKERSCGKRELYSHKNIAPQFS